jgi:hypothetical protein
MKRWQLSILIFELALFAAILVLPQVALPVVAFPEGTAPVAAHARVCDPAPGTAITIAPQILPAEPMVQVRAETPDVSAPPAVHSRLSRLCVLIC